MRTAQKGFTLIELMIVVAIIGILAAIGLPAYQDYIIRTQVSEGLSISSSVKSAVAENFAQTGKWPADLEAIGFDKDNPPSGKYVQQVTLNNGTITITYGNSANARIKDKTLTLRPGTTPNGDVFWGCGVNTADDKAALIVPNGSWEDDSGTASETSDGGSLAATASLKSLLPAECRIPAS